MSHSNKKPNLALRNLTHIQNVFNMLPDEAQSAADRLPPPRPKTPEKVPVVVKPGLSKRSEDLLRRMTRDPNRDVPTIVPYGDFSETDGESWKTAKNKKGKARVKFAHFTGPVTEWQDATSECDAANPGQDSDAHLPSVPQEVTILPGNITVGTDLDIHKEIGPEIPGIWCDPVFVHRKYSPQDDGWRGPRRSTFKRPQGYNPGLPRVHAQIELESKDPTCTYISIPGDTVVVTERKRPAVHRSAVQAAPPPKHYNTTRYDDLTPRQKQSVHHVSTAALGLQADLRQANKVADQQAVQIEELQAVIEAQKHEIIERESFKHQSSMLEGYITHLFRENARLRHKDAVARAREAAQSSESTIEELRFALREQQENNSSLTTCLAKWENQFQQLCRETQSLSDRLNSIEETLNDPPREDLTDLIACFEWQHMISKSIDTLGRELLSQQMESQRQVYDAAIDGIRAAYFTLYDAALDKYFVATYRNGERDGRAAMSKIRSAQHAASSVKIGYELAQKGCTDAEQLKRNQVLFELGALAGPNTEQQRFWESSGYARGMHDAASIVSDPKDTQARENMQVQGGKFVESVAPLFEFLPQLDNTDHILAKLYKSRTHPLAYLHPQFGTSLPEEHADPTLDYYKGTWSKLHSMYRKRTLEVPTDQTLSLPRDLRYKYSTAIPQPKVSKNGSSNPGDDFPVDPRDTHHIIRTARSAEQHTSSQTTPSKASRGLLELDIGAEPYSWCSETSWGRYLAKQQAKAPRTVDHHPDSDREYAALIPEEEVEDPASLAREDVPESWEDE